MTRTIPSRKKSCLCQRIYQSRSRQKQGWSAAVGDRAAVLAREISPLIRLRFLAAHRLLCESLLWVAIFPATPPGRRQLTAMTPYRASSWIIFCRELVATDPSADNYLLYRRLINVILAVPVLAGCGTAAAVLQAEQITGALQRIAAWIGGICASFRIHFLRTQN